MRGWLVVDLGNSQSREQFTQVVENYEIIHCFPLKFNVPQQMDGKFGPYQKDTLKDVILVIFETVDPYEPDSVVGEVKMKGGADVKPKAKD